ncbi:MAG: phosphotransferase [Blastocatellia bacterium]
MANRNDFQRLFPGAFYLDANDLPALTAYLQAQRWIGADETVLEAARAGEGNMNCTIRVRTATQTLIVKQARPWVEKYPDIPAPRERAAMEGRFYQAISATPALAALMPQYLGLDETSQIIALEDLGAAQDFTTLYRGARLDAADLEALVAWLSALHALPGTPDQRAQMANREMRALNHLHLFDFPLRQTNGMDLDAITPGLQAAARTLQQDLDYVTRARALGELYLADGPALLHGDYFPGSWLRTARGVRIIDPEFCFYGPPEFDMGVLIAHLHLAGQHEDLTLRALSVYQSTRPLHQALVRQFAGIEIMRRLIGVAQLPVTPDPESKTNLLQLSRALVLES